MRLSNGHYLFFINSWIMPSPGYQPAWVITNGSDPTQILASAPKPLWSPSREPWLAGVDPWQCNVCNVSFVEAAHPIDGRQDEFRVYFGGADAVLGTATVKITVP